MSYLRIAQISQVKTSYLVQSKTKQPYRIKLVLDLLIEMKEDVHHHSCKDELICSKGVTYENQALFFVYHDNVHYVSPCPDFLQQKFYQWELGKLFGHRRKLYLAGHLGGLGKNEPVFGGKNFLQYCQFRIAI